MASGVTPRQAYQALINAGASTTQAIGILANAINESGIDPEARNPSDPNGGSYGFVQQNGAGYAGLVTGNPPVDLKAQIAILAQNGGFKAASGSTPAAAAGNFAAGYERCQGCQPGGPQYNSRVANAATVAGWVSSGKWPTSSGSPAGAAAAGPSAAQGGPASPCLIQISGPSVPVLGSLGQACLLSKSEARAIIGGALMVGSAFAALVGLLIVAAAGFRESGAGRAAGGALEGAGAALAFVPGAQGAGLAVGAAGATARRAGSSGAASASLQRRRAARSQAAAAQQRQAAAAQRTSQRQAAAAARTPRGRHAKTGPNAPATGRHAGP
jgi:hypothetical protein